METKVKKLRLDVRDLVKQYDKTEDDLSALQSVGNIIGEVLKDLGNDKFIVKSSSGPRYVVGVRSRLDQSLLKQGTRVALDMTTLTIMRLLPREVDPTVFQMQSEEEGKVSFSAIGGLTEQIRELREVIEVSLGNGGAGWTLGWRGGGDEGGDTPADDVRAPPPSHQACTVV